MKEYKYKINGEEYVVKVDEVDVNTYDVTVNDVVYKVETETASEPEHKVVAPVVSSHQNEPVAAEDVSAGEALKAPLPGVITEIKVAVGDVVSAGDTVLVLEAMKMANNIEAERGGKVLSICVKQGENVMEDTPLVIIG